ncbi:MAG: GNAT family N-acetyltransferase [Frankiaceae bacterium]
MSEAPLLPSEGEHLTTGWEPSVPPEDTLVRQAVLAHGDWLWTQGQAAARPHRRGGGWVGAYLTERAPMSNMCVLLQPPADTAALLAEVGEFYPPHVPALVLSPWPLGDLTVFGLDKVGHPPLMLHLPYPGLAPHPPPGSPPGVSIREARTAADLETVERILVEGFPMPELSPLTAGELLPPALLGGNTHAWLAEDGHRPLACAVAHLGVGVVLVQLVATLPDARGRGAGAGVTWAATLADPTRRAVLLASDAGRPIYERMGYVAIERWSIWLRPGS